jgi:hypothetical protein
LLFFLSLRLSFSFQGEEILLSYFEQLWLSEMKHVNVWKLSDVSAKISVAIFTLRKATAVSAESWYNFQHSTQLMPGSKNCNLYSSCRNLTTSSITFRDIFQITVTCLCHV